MKKLLCLMGFGVALIAGAEETSNVDYGQTTVSPTLELIWSFDYVTYEEQTCARITGVRNSGGATIRGDISIPETVIVSRGGTTEAYLVKAIAADAFKNQLGISSINISCYVEDIGIPFCQGCTALSSITVDEDNYWFSGRNDMLFDDDGTILIACPPAIDTVQLPAMTTTIGDFAFRGCHRIKKVSIPAKVKSIGSQAFANCKKLESVTFLGNAPDTETEDLFSGTTPAITVFIPKGNKTFGEIPGTWQGQQLSDGSENVSTTDSEESAFVTWIYRVINGQYAELCNDEDACISETISETYHIDEDTGALVGDGALIIPSTLGGYPVTSIGSNAFKNCSALVNISIPDSVNTIGDNAFQNCSGLNSINIPSGVKTIGRHPFDGSSLTALTLPSLLQKLNGNPLAGCEALLSVSIDANNSYFTVIDGLIYDKDKELLIGCPARKETASIATTCTEIGQEAFAGCFRISSLSIPEKVCVIDEKAFADMPRLTSLIIPASVSSIHGAALFGETSAIKTIHFSGNAPSVDEDIFLHTTETMTNIVNEGTTGWNGNPTSTDLPSDKKWPITGGNRRSIRFQDSGGSTTEDDPVGRQEYTDNSGNTWIYTVEQGKARLGLWGATPVLKNANASGVITVPSTLNGYPLSVLPDHAFESCKNITTVEIPASINTIGEGVFNGCTSLEEIKVDSKNTDFCSKYGALYSKDGKTLIKVPAKFDFDRTITVTTNSTDRTLRITGVYFDDNMVRHNPTTNIIYISATTITSTRSEHHANVSQNKLFGEVRKIENYAFTDCGAVSLPADFSDTLNNGNPTIVSIDMPMITDKPLRDIQVHYSYAEILTIPTTVSTVGEYAAYNSHFTEIIDHSTDPVVTTLGSIATTFGMTDPTIDTVIDTDAELSEFNSFLRSVGIVPGSSISAAQRDHLLDSYEISAVTPTPILLTDTPTITLDKFEQGFDANNMDLRISLQAGSQPIEMAKEKIRNMIKVGTSLSDINLSPKILASPDTDGSTVYFTVSAPDDLSGSSSLFYRVKIKR